MSVLSFFYQFVQKVLYQNKYLFSIKLGEACLLQNGLSGVRREDEGKLL